VNQKGTVNDLAQASEILQIIPAYPHKGLRRRDVKIKSDNLIELRTQPQRNPTEEIQSISTLILRNFAEH